MGHHLNGKFSYSGQSAEQPVKTELVVQPLKRRMVRASCGFGHALFVDELGFALSWGSNTYGQLGLGDIYFRSNV